MSIRVRASADSVASGTNANVVVTIPAESVGRTAAAYIGWSYSDTPTGGRLTVATGGVTIFDVDITAGGPGALRPVPLPSDPATSIVITLYAGGAGIVGKLNAYAGKY